jgi:hypothetical protein
MYSPWRLHTCVFLVVPACTLCGWGSMHSAATCRLVLNSAVPLQYNCIAVTRGLVSNRVVLVSNQVDMSAPAAMLHPQGSHAATPQAQQVRRPYGRCADSELLRGSQDTAGLHFRHLTSSPAAAAAGSRCAAAPPPPSAAAGAAPTPSTHASCNAPHHPQHHSCRAGLLMALLAALYRGLPGCYCCCCCCVLVGSWGRV